MEVIGKGYPVRCPGCQKTVKKRDRFGDKKSCGFCYFRESFLRKSDNSGIDDFLIRFAVRRRYPFLEFIPYEELSNVKKIGQGGFSQVYKATWNRGRICVWYRNGNFTRYPPETVALKVLNESQEMNSEFLNEQQFLNRLRCSSRDKKYIINVYGISQDPVPEIKEIMRMVEEWKSNYYQQFKEAEEARKKIIESGAPFMKEHYSDSIYYSKLLDSIIESARSTLNSRDLSNTRFIGTPEYQIKTGLECQQESESTNFEQTEVFSKLIPYKEFSNIEEIGQGRSSQVYKATWYSKTVALRILNESENLDPEFLIKSESLIFKKHAGIIRCYGISQDPTSMNHILVTEHRLDLSAYLQANFIKMTWFNKRMILNSIALRIMTIHKWNIIRWNLHSGNLFVVKGRKPNPAVLIDLGFNRATRGLNLIEQATRNFYANDYHQFQKAEEKRKKMISFLKEAEQNHPKSVYHTRPLNTIIEIANAIQNSGDSSKAMKHPGPIEIQVEPQKGVCSNCKKKRHYADLLKKICRLCSFAELFPKSNNQDINNFLIKSSENEGRRILEWISYEDFEIGEDIGSGGYSKVCKATWHRGHIKRWIPQTGEVVRSGPVEVALKVLKNSKDMDSKFLNELENLYKFKSSDLGYRHIVKCYGVSQDPKSQNYILIMQYANNGSLREFLKDRFHNKANWNFKKKVILSLLESINEIHRQEIRENLDPDELQAAEEKREEMVKFGIPFVEKPRFEHPKSVYSSRSLDSQINFSKTILSDSSNAKEILELNSNNVSENSLKKHEIDKTDDYREIID
ncbi:11460_t:CDS:10, partial [Acaulospora morrowiae]